jgi:ketosteroid isomerase-like protein
LRFGFVRPAKFEWRNFDEEAGDIGCGRGRDRFVCFLARQSSAKESDETEIRTMEAAMIKAYAAKDLDNGLAGYVQDETLFVFDAIPPRQYVGIKAWRADNEGFVAMFQGPLKVEMSDLSITANGKLGFGHNIQRFSGTDKNGKPIDMTFRVSDEPAGHRSGLRATQSDRTDALQ